MKKTKLTTANTGGIPFQALDFQFIQDESWKGIVSHLKALYANYPYGFVVQGCTSTIGGATYDISEGYVFLNGDIIYFPAVTGILLATSPVYYEGTATAEARNYESGGSFTFAESKTVTTSVTSGDTITFTSTGTQRTYLNALTTQPKLKTDIWTPTVTNIANTSSVSGAVCDYVRIGDGLMCSGFIVATATSAGTATSVRITLPTNPSVVFATTDLAKGTCVFQQTGALTSVAASGIVYSESATNTVILSLYTSTGVGAGRIYFNFSYRI